MACKTGHVIVDLAHRGACFVMLTAVLCLAAAGACEHSKGSTSGTEPSPTTPSPTPTPTPAPAPTGIAAALQTLAGRAIYFGHQSVGFNIMDGVQALIAATPGTTLRVVQTSSPPVMTRGVFAHDGNGSNGDPRSKVEAFVATMQQGAGTRADIAFFKFCYVDFTAGTDTAAVFADYQTRLAALRSAFPAVRIVHVTVPLTTDAPAENTVRERFSDLVRQAYEGREPLFDLARLESTRPDGSAHLVGGVRALVSTYASDDGHLNAAGQDLVARALVLYLAGL
jgi:hypothetical protein